MSLTTHELKYISTDFKHLSAHDIIENVISPPTKSEIVKEHQQDPVLKYWFSNPLVNIEIDVMNCV